MKSGDRFRRIESGASFMSAGGLIPDPEGEWVVHKTTEYEDQERSRARAIDRIEELRTELRNTQAALKEAMNRLSMSPGIVDYHIWEGAPEYD